MTVSTTQNRVSYAGNGVTTAFAFPYVFFDSADLVVLLVNVDGTSTQGVLGTDYTVTGAGLDAGGTVTMTAAPASGTTLVVYRDPQMTQPQAFVDNDPLPAKSISRGYDRLTLIAQRIRELANRSFRLSDSDTSGASPILPPPAPSTLIGWNSAGTGLANRSVSDLATVVAYGTSNADKFTGDGVKTAFTLSANPGAIANLDVSISGISQVSGRDFTWDGNVTLTFTSAPPAPSIGGDTNVYVRYMRGLPQSITDAGAVTYTQGGASAVSRSVQDKAREVVSVKDFGAKGDGVTNDTAAIQAAITAMGSAGNLVWPAGTYLCSATLMVSCAWFAFGTVTIKFSGLSSTTDCITISGGASYLPTVFDNFIVDCSATGRDGVVLLNGDHPRIRVNVKNAQRDGFAVYCNNFDWVENAFLDILTQANGRNGMRMEMAGTNGAFFNESILRLEVRGVSLRYNGGVGLYSICSGTNAGTKVSALHIEAINLDAQRAAAVANGFDIGMNPIYIDYAAGGTNKHEAWDIRGGGFETTTGTDDFRSQYLIYAVAGTVCAYWDVRGIVPANWSTGDGVFGLTDVAFHSCKNSGGLSGLASLSTVGNVGVGVGNSTWGNGFRAIEVGALGNALFGSTSGSCNILWTNNAYYDGSNWRYSRSLQASHYEQISGTHKWNVAATGTAGNVITWSLAALLDINGNYSLLLPGAGLRVKEGSNAKQGVATLAAGSVVVSNTSVTSTSRIMLTTQTPGGTVGAVYVSARVAGTSFTITSTSGADTSTVAYQIFEPA
jgi:hypothetical protein